MRVPDAVRLKLGMCEVHRSLKTYSQARARLLAAVLVPHVQEVFRMAKANTMSRLQLTSLLRSYFDELASEVDGGFVPVSDQPELEIAEQREMSLGRIDELQAQVSCNAFDLAVQDAAARVIGSKVADLIKLPAAFQSDVCHGAARAEIEQLKLLVHRLTDRLSLYQPSDPLFCLPVTAAPAASAALTESIPLGPSLGAAVEHHLKSGESRWTLKTYKGKKVKLGYLIEHMGAETPIKSITPDMIRSYKAAITRLRSNHHAGNSRNFAEKQTENPKHWIAAETVLNIYNPTRAFFAWATNVEGYLAVNPAANIRIEAPKKTKGTKARRPFSGPELVRMFSAPAFTGCTSASRRFTGGKLKLKDDYFWIPVLGLYTGARLGELVQLHLRDVVTEGPVPYIEITEYADKSAAGHPHKHVKSDAGIRKIPLHREVLELGFGEFVARRKKHRRSPRLFHQIKIGADGQASTVFSKWFARLLDRVDLKDPALTFHSLRHGFQDALRDAKQPQYIIDRLFGHASGTTAGEYGTGASLDVLAKAIGEMKLKVNLTTLWVEP